MVHYFVIKFIWRINMKKIGYIFFTVSVLMTFFFGVDEAYAKNLEGGGNGMQEEKVEANEQKGVDWQDKAEQRKQDVEAKREERQATKEEWAEKRCTMAQERIQQREQKAEQNHNKYVDYYEKLRLRLEEHLGRLKDKGCDVSKSTSELNTLNDKIEALNGEHNSYMKTFREMNGAACSEDRSELSTSLSEAKSMLQNVKNRASELRNYVRTTLKQSLKTQIRECNTTLGAENTEEE